MLISWLTFGVVALDYHERKVVVPCHPLLLEGGFVRETSPNDPGLWSSIWVFLKIMAPPNHPFVHRVFHEINHPFWG